VLDEECPLNQICKDGECKNQIAENPCTSKSDCNDNQVCKNKLCKSKEGGECFSFRDCVKPLTCDGEGKCINPIRALDNGVEIVE